MGTRPSRGRPECHISADTDLPPVGPDASRFYVQLRPNPLLLVEVWIKHHGGNLLQARRRAIVAAARTGEYPAAERDAGRKAITFKELAERFDNPRSRQRSARAITSGSLFVVMGVTILPAACVGFLNVPDDD